MNQTESDARVQFFNRGAISSLGGTPSLEYLRAMKELASNYLAQVSNMLEEKIKQLPTTVPIKKAVRLKYASGTKLYWHGIFGWKTEPLWLEDNKLLIILLKEAKNNNRNVAKQIKLVHIKCKCTTPHLDWPAKYHTINCPLSKSR
jgi:hypothetical protein